MKMFPQLLMTDDGHGGNDALHKDGSSILGKYIIGAKNNFRGFHSSKEDKNVPLQVTVHHGEEGVNKEKVADAESDTQQNQVAGGETEDLKQVTDCDVVKMEEGRAKAELGDKTETERKEKEEEAKTENTDNEVKEEVVAGTSFNNVEEKVKSTQDESDKKKEGEALTGAKVGEKHTETTPDQAKNISSEKTDTESVLNKFKDIELQERKQPKWMKGKQFEQNAAEKSGVRESNEKPGGKKIIPSPTGSASSQDTGFGSQEGEGSIDGILVRP